MRLLPAALLFLFVGCAAPSKLTRSIHDTEVFPASFNRIWAVLIASLAEQSIPIQVIEKESGIVTTQFVSFSNAYRVAHAPGGCFMCLWRSPRYYMSVFVTPIGDRTRVKATAHIEVFEWGWVDDYKVWDSNGALESELLTSIRELVNPTGSPAVEVPDSVFSRKAR